MLKELITKWSSKKLHIFTPSLFLYLCPSRNIMHIILDEALFYIFKKKLTDTNIQVKYISFPKYWFNIHYTIPIQNNDYMQIESNISYIFIYYIYGLCNAALWTCFFVPI